ncbi:MAG: DNA translocase FtsK 4TM domain-containing protein [Deltaproteobacteria bacterium]|nr:DNA translocase FtsK 4TM domain-containing protein [Deltaproteobacteria bacterium]
MAVKKNADHSREIFGLVFLAVGIFFCLCLLSYRASDPSFSSLGHGKAIHNLGGIVGSYTADLLVTLLGYGAYGIILSFFLVAFAALSARKEIFTWSRQIALVVFVAIAALFFHLRGHEVFIGGKPQDAGGIVGWFLGALLTRTFGIIGTYLFIVFGTLLTFLWATEIRVGRLVGILSELALFLQKRVGSFLLLSIARAEKGWIRLGQRFHQWKSDRKKLKEAANADFGPRVVREPVAIRAEPKKVLKEIKAKEPPSVPLALKPQASVAVVDSVASSAVEPKILPRADADLKKKKPEQMEILAATAEFVLPPLNLLDSEDGSDATPPIDEESLKLNSKLLEQKLVDYDVSGRVTEIHPGPIITMYEFEPAPGVKVNKIVNLEDDLSLIMGGKSVRIVAPIPGKPVVGIEIPNNNRETVWLKDVIGHSKYQKNSSKLTLALGKDTEGIPYVADLAKMPHLLVAGATGSGKSVSVNTMILSFLYKATPEDVRFLMIDLKMLELPVYNEIPHLLLPVVTNPKKASLALRWATSEMERRYELLSQKSARNLAGYNKLVSKEEHLPMIVIVIDELADLMMTAANDVEKSITRLAQMARAAGIHLILATQRPSVDVLTGLIKANFPARISFKVSSKHDSRTILDTVGSEHLLGYGDMLFMSPGTGGLIRVHGSYVSETEILRVVEHLKKQGAPKYDESILQVPEGEAAEEGSGSGDGLEDTLYDEAVSLVSQTRQASISMIQRRLRIGYNRAARLVERMEKEGVVGPADGAKPREVYAANLNQT